MKYLSDKELLNSSFVVVDPVTPDNCDEIISAKIFEIYFDIIYDRKKPEEDERFQIDYIIKINGVADVVLKSLLYDKESQEARDLNETIKKMRTIAELIGSWKSYKLNDNVKNLQIINPDSAIELCLKHDATTNIFPNYVKTTKRIEQLKSYDVKDLKCEILITLFRKHLEVHLLETLPKLNSDKEQICVKNAYVKLNMTEKFSDVFTFSTMKDVSLDDTFYLYRTYCYDVAAFYEMTMECARIGFILKDVAEMRNVYSIDFTRENYMFSVKYEENYGIIVKFHQNRSLNEFLIIANETSQVMNNSGCLLEGKNLLS